MRWPAPQLALRLAATNQARAAVPAAIRTSITASSTAVVLGRHIHSTTASSATVSPGTGGSGPPPEPPKPAADDTAHLRIERRRKQADMLKKAQTIRAAGIAKAKTNSPLARKRFWKDVHVKEVDGAWEVHLDTRPLRHPNTKEIVRVPLSKPLLAEALAHEWDMLVSAQQATKQHLIPLTSLTCRAIDISADDRHWDSLTAKKPGDVSESIRAQISRTVLRYLDTDSLLCWAPAPKSDDTPGPNGLSLRETQQEVAEGVVGYLGSRVWPGVEIEPVLDEESIFPKTQKPETRQIIEGWVMGLDSWELAGLERGVLASKSLLCAARFLVEWSEGNVSGAGRSDSKTFGVDEAARTASIEVDWQTGRWGEVEDTHDVEKEDLRRQLGSVVLLVGGAGTK